MTIRDIIREALEERIIISEEDVGTAVDKVLDTLPLDDLIQDEIDRQLPGLARCLVEDVVADNLDDLVEDAIREALDL